MKILITGATGFLGTFLCPALETQENEIIALSSKTCDLTNENALQPFKKTKFDQIYHLAVWTQAGDFCLKHPGEQWLINQKINTNMLDFWQKHQPQAKMITVGTSCSYDPAYPLSEDYYLSGKPINSLLAYGMTKRMLLSGLIALQKQFGLEFLYLIPSTLYGPGYHADERQLHFIFDLIRKILRGVHYQEPVILWGDGEQKRELIHIEDFVQMMLELATTSANTWINVGGGKEHSIKTFARKICKIAHYPFEKIHFDTSKYVGARSKVLLIDKVKALLPNFTQKTLDEGLRGCIESEEEIILRKSALLSH